MISGTRDEHEPQSRRRHALIRARRDRPHSRPRMRPPTAAPRSRFGICIGHDAASPTSAMTSAAGRRRATEAPCLRFQVIEHPRPYALAANGRQPSRRSCHFFTPRWRRACRRKYYSFSFRLRPSTAMSAIELLPGRHLYLVCGSTPAAISAHFRLVAPPKNHTIPCRRLMALFRFSTLIDATSTANQHIDVDESARWPRLLRFTMLT